MKERSLWGWACLGLATIVVAGITSGAKAIEPGDTLEHGQDLVDRATTKIDELVAQMRIPPIRAEPTYRQIRYLLGWSLVYADSIVAPHYPLDQPAGLLITDGIADTIATRLSWVVDDFVEQNPEELLSPGRQALELLIAQTQLPPGLFLGFHLHRMALVYAARADSVLADHALADPEGVYDGYIRRLRDLTQLYDQTHVDAANKYFCRVKQEDWIIYRTRCTYCGHQGLRFRDQYSEITEDSSAACQEILRSRDASPEAIDQRFDCRHWSHYFTTVCPECENTSEFRVPLPFYRTLQRRMALGLEEPPDPSMLMRDMGGEGGEK